MLVILPEKWNFDGGADIIPRADALDAVLASGHGCSSLPPNVNSALRLSAPGAAGVIIPGVEMIVFGAVITASRQPQVFFSVDAVPDAANIANAPVEGDPCGGALLHLARADLNASKPLHPFTMTMEDDATVLIFNATIFTADDLASTTAQPASSSAAASGGVPAPPAARADNSPTLLAVIGVLAVVTAVAIAAFAWLLWRGLRERRLRSRGDRDGSPSPYDATRQPDIENSPIELPANNRRTEKGLRVLEAPRQINLPVVNPSPVAGPSRAEKLVAIKALPELPRAANSARPPGTDDSEVGAEDTAEVGAAVREAAQGAGLSVEAIITSLNRVQPSRTRIGSHAEMSESYLPTYDDDGSAENQTGGRAL